MGPSHVMYYSQSSLGSTCPHSTVISAAKCGNYMKRTEDSCGLGEIAQPGRARVPSFRSQWGRGRNGGGHFLLPQSPEMVAGACTSQSSLLSSRQMKETSQKSWWVVHEGQQLRFYCPHMPSCVQTHARIHICMHTDAHSPSLAADLHKLAINWARGPTLCQALGSDVLYFGGETGAMDLWTSVRLAACVCVCVGPPLLAEFPGGHAFAMYLASAQASWRS